MTPQTVFLRSWCILPERLKPRTVTVNEHWTQVEEIAAPVLETEIRRMGWHFLCMLRPSAERGYGSSEADAVRSALVNALHGVAKKYNSAELVKVSARRYPFFHAATVTLQPRQIQQFTDLEISAEWQRMIEPSR